MVLLELRGAVQAAALPMAALRTRAADVLMLHIQKYDASFY